MFSKIKSLRTIVSRKHKKHTLPYQINDIRDAICEISNIDHIIFAEFDAGDNPVIGRYDRYEGQIGPYSNGTRIDIYYSKTLNRCWGRYVVCKEMCHALLDESTTRVDGIERLRTLVDHLLLPDISKDALSACPPFASEKLAEIAAIELLCPVEDRKSIAARRAAESISDMRIATEFRIPVDWVKRVFDQKYIDLMDYLIWNTR